MELRGQRICITGGGGCIGSHLADRLIENNEVVVIDRFGSGRREWVPDAAEIVVGDLRHPEDVARAIDRRTDFVFHCAADKAVNSEDPDAQFHENTLLTSNVLARMAEVGCDRISFTSSSTVYGEAPRPTAEDHAPLEPISMYGAAKLAEEGLLSVYAHTKDFEVWNFRFANIVGPRLQLGAVIPDFIHKLQQDATTLEILGNGRQEKSYLHIRDCISGMCYAIEHASHQSGPVHTYNLGTNTTTAVHEIAEVVCDVLDVDPTIEYTGGTRGWTGDVPKMRLSIQKLAALGWEPEVESTPAVRTATEELVSRL